MEQIKTAIIEEGVTSIGAYAFQECNALEAVYLPSTIKNINRNAFRSCNNLTSITLPEGLETLEYSVFEQCSALQSIHFPSSLIKIDNSCFKGSGLQGVIIVPDTVTNLGENAFYGCHSITQIAFPKDLAIIPRMAACFCNSLEEAIVGSGTKAIADFAFSSCEALKKVSIPASVINIGYGSFEDCSALEDVHYAGLSEDANKISIGQNNDGLVHAVWHYYSCWSLQGEGHTLKAHAKSDATCTEAGTQAYWECERCQRLFSDEEAINEIETPIIIEAPIGHNWDWENIKYYVEAEQEYPVDYLNYFPDRPLFTITGPQTVLAYRECKNHKLDDEGNEIWHCHDMLEIERADCQEWEMIDKLTCTDEGMAKFSFSFLNDQVPHYIETRVLYPKGHIEDVDAEPYLNEDASVMAVDVHCVACGEHLFTQSEEVLEVSWLEEPTCESGGTKLYYAPLNINSPYVYEYWEAIGHDWGETSYNWDLENLQVTAKHICNRDNTHTETETANITIVISREATCTESELSSYMGSFSNPAFGVEPLIFETNAALGHTLKAHAKVEATCTKTGTEAYWECEACGDLFSDAEGKNKIEAPIAVHELGHEWGAPTYSWNADNSRVTATRVCAHDNKHTEIEEVGTSRELIKEPTDEEAGVYQIVSKEFNNPAFEVQTKDDQPIPALDTLNVLKLPAFLKTIETEAFEGVAAEAIIIPDGCTTIEPKAFINCKNLLYIRIPAGVEIPDDAFSGCPNFVIDQR